MAGKTATRAATRATLPLAEAEAAAACGCGAHEDGNERWRVA